MNNTISTFVGTGTKGFTPTAIVHIALLSDPTGIAVASNGDVYVAEKPSAFSAHTNGDLYIADYLNFVIRKVSNGIITTIAVTAGIYRN